MLPFNIIDVGLLKLLFSSQSLLQCHQATWRFVMLVNRVGASATVTWPHPSMSLTARAIAAEVRGTRLPVWYPMLPILGPKPHILPDHKVRTKTPQSQPVQEKSVPFVFVTVLTTWHKKGRVRNSVWDFNAAAVAVCECGFVRAALQR